MASLAAKAIPGRPDHASRRLSENHEVPVLAGQRSWATLANPRVDVKLQAGHALFVIGPER
jgi:hypothetical protein